jgi:hypothetical protein
VTVAPCDSRSRVTLPGEDPDFNTGEKYALIVGLIGLSGR